MDVFIERTISHIFANARNLDQLVDLVIKGTYKFKEIKDKEHTESAKEHKAGRCTHRFQKGTARNLFCNKTVTDGNLCHKHSGKKGKIEIPKEYTMENKFITLMNGKPLDNDQKLAAIAKRYPIKCSSTAEKTGNQCSNKCCEDAGNKFLCNVHFRASNKKILDTKKEKSEKKQDSDDSSSDSDDDDNTKTNIKEALKAAKGSVIVVSKETVNKLSSLSPSHLPPGGP